VGGTGGKRQKKGGKWSESESLGGLEERDKEWRQGKLAGSKTLTCVRPFCKGL